MIKEKILKKFLNTKNNVYYTRCKKGLLPFFYNGLQDFAAKLKFKTKQLIKKIITKKIITKKMNYAKFISRVLKLLPF